MTRAREALAVASTAFLGVALVFVAGVVGAIILEAWRSSP